MTFQAAKRLAQELPGCKLPTFNSASPIAGCWIDRMEWVRQMCQAPGIHGALRLEDAIKEANRYAGR
jgi:hypothetical protein